MLTLSDEAPLVIRMSTAFGDHVMKPTTTSSVRRSRVEEVVKIRIPRLSSAPKWYPSASVRDEHKKKIVDDFLPELMSEFSTASIPEERGGYGTPFLFPRAAAVFSHKLSILRGPTAGFRPLHFLKQNPTAKSLRRSWALAAIKRTCHCMVFDSTIYQTPSWTTWSWRRTLYKRNAAVKPTSFIEWQRPPQVLP